MTKRKAIRKSIRHWRRMVRWAKKQDPDSRKWSVVMMEEIGEFWSDHHCALCQEYEESDCRGCPLSEIGECCHKYNSAYDVVACADTWGGFVNAGKNMIRVLKSLRWFRRKS